MAKILVFRSKDEKEKERVDKLLEQALDSWGLGPEFTEQAKKEVRRINRKIEEDFACTASLVGSFTPEQKESVGKYTQDVLAGYREKVVLALVNELIWCKLYEMKREFERRKV